MSIYGAHSGATFFNLIPKPKVFISYHHDNDQWYYNRFSQLFGSTYDIMTDRSVDRIIRSEDVEYQRNRIRDEYISGTSLTIVLCGADSYKRKFIDWEICATLNKDHALLGIILPTNPVTTANGYLVPDRLYDNVNTRYAHWILWTEDITVIKNAIIQVKLLGQQTSLINNSRPCMQRNAS